MALLSRKFLDNPANYLYLFASAEFLSKLDSKSATIIASKAYYQKKIVINEVTNANYEKAREELRDAFIAIYDKTPAQALIDLASGKTIAGKNWESGVYGVGKVKTNTFATNNAITVNPTTGEILNSGKVVSTADTALIGTNKKHDNIIGYTYTDENGTCYTSNYNRLTGKYYCGQATDADGNVRLADGSKGNQSNMSSLWEGIISDIWDYIKNILNKLKIGEGEKLLDEKKSLPDQKKDGFSTPSTPQQSDWLPWLLAGGAAAAIIIPKMKKSKKSKK